MMEVNEKITIAITDYTNGVTPQNGVTILYNSGKGEDCMIPYYTVGPNYTKFTVVV